MLRIPLFGLRCYPDHWVICYRRQNSKLPIMSLSHFYLTLPSNSSQLYYPNNSMTRYSTRLQSAIELTGNYEMALVEIAFSHTWYTIQEGGNFISVSIGPILESLAGAHHTEPYNDADYTFRHHHTLRVLQFFTGDL